MPKKGLILKNLLQWFTAQTYIQIDVSWEGKVCVVLLTEYAHWTWSMSMVAMVALGDKRH